MKTVRHYIWLVTGIFSRYRKLIFTGFFGGILMFVIGTRVAPLIWRYLKAEHHIIGLVGSYSPTNLPMSIQRQVSLGLTEIDSEGTPSAALARSWDISEDGKEYTFHLRDDLQWHDGKPFTAYDVNYNLKDVEFTPLEDTKLLVKLKEPFTPLPSFLSKPLFRKGLIGLGAYKISSIRLKGETVSYLKLEALHNDLPLVEIKFYPSENLAKTAFKLGEVNMLDEIIDETAFHEWQTVTIRENSKYNQYVAIFFNLNDSLLKEKEIRQALAFAIDKPEKNQLLTPISTQSWVYTTRVKQYEKDTDLSKKMLTALKLPPQTTITLSTFPQYLNLAQRIASAWGAVGVQTRVKVEDGVPSEYQALLASQEIPTDPDQYPLWHSTQTETNITHYANPKIDKLLEDGRKEKDPEIRKKLYFDFQRYLVDDAPVIFLFHPTTYTVMRK